MMLDPILPMSPEVIKAEAVFFGIDDRKKPIAASGPLGRINLQLKH
jgi:hypothetical protein